ncbi:post-PEP-CTERM-1 domain-containing protein [Roseateles sp.]|jgi:hypothetical protein|uniref:post-PEP-CTERM-1 domain-containing protein n=1 Tax=Roseateles sp. TaxID=1971397 RepID=UPI003BA902F0
MKKTISVSAGALALAFTLLAPLSASAGEAMRVVRDPVTGEMRGPTAAEAAAFAKAEAQLRLGSGSKAIVKTPVEIRYPDGTVETKLDEDSMMFSVVSANEDGTLNFDCLPAQEAKQFMKDKAPAKSASKAKAAAKVKHDH